MGAQGAGDDRARLGNFLIAEHFMRLPIVTALELLTFSQLPEEHMANAFDRSLSSYTEYEVQ